MPHNTLWILNIDSIPIIDEQQFWCGHLIDVALALIATFIVFPPALVYLDSWRDKRLGIAMPETNEVY